MRKRLLVCLLVPVLSFITLSFSGCIAVVAGGAVGGTAFVLGDLEVDVDGSPEEVRAAIVAAGKDLKLKAISGNGDELNGSYVFRTAQDDKVSVKYEAITDTFVKLNIRVGNFGDESLSNRINQAIQKHL